MRLWREAGARAPCSSSHQADSEEEAIRLANATPLGLGASVWTADRFKGRRIARELQVGMVWMNDHLVARSAPQVPWGGVEGLRHRARARRDRAAHLRRAEGRHLGPARRRPGLVVPLRRDARAGGRAAVVGLRSARDADRERAWREDALPIARVTGRWLRGLRPGR